MCVNSTSWNDYEEISLHRWNIHIQPNIYVCAKKECMLYNLKHNLVFSHSALLYLFLDGPLHSPLPRGAGGERPVY